MLLACGSPQRPPPEITNHEASAAPAPRACAQGISGKVIQRGNGPVVGATLVAGRRDASPRDDDMQVTISEQEGRFTLSKLDSFDRLTVFYDDTTYEGALPRECEEVLVMIGDKGKAGEVYPLTVERLPH